MNGSDISFGRGRVGSFNAATKSRQAMRSNGRNRYIGGDGGNQSSRSASLSENKRVIIKSVEASSINHLAGRLVSGRISMRRQIISIEYEMRRNVVAGKRSSEEMQPLKSAIIRRDFFNERERMVGRGWACAVDNASVLPKSKRALAIMFLFAAQMFDDGRQISIGVSWQYSK